MLFLSWQSRHTATKTKTDISLPTLLSYEITISEKVGDTPKHPESGTIQSSLAISLVARYDC